MGKSRSSRLLSFTALTTSVVISTTSMTTMATRGRHPLELSAPAYELSDSEPHWKDDIIPPFSLLLLVILGSTADRAKKQGASASLMRTIGVFAGIVSCFPPPPLGKGLESWHHFFCCKTITGIPNPPDIKLTSVWKCRNTWQRWKLLVPPQESSAGWHAGNKWRGWKCLSRAADAVHELWL